MKEIWKPVLEYETRYEVSSLGRIRRLFNHKNLKAFGIKKATINGVGYFVVNLSKKGVKKKLCYVHILVLEAFYGPRPESCQEARHLDGNKLNCSTENLKWGTWLEQCQDKKIHGTIPIEYTPIKLNPTKVNKMRKLRESGLKLKDIATKFSVGTRAAYEAINRITWKEVA